MGHGQTLAQGGRRPAWAVALHAARSKFTRRAAAACLALALAGCEAPLQLAGVTARTAEPVRRSDQFQMAAGYTGVVVVVGNQGLVVRSVDRGRNWHRQQLPGWPALIAVNACPDGTFAALAAEGQVWISGDAGQTWTAHALPSSETPQGIECDAGNRLWVVGSFSTIFSSSDAGRTWEDQSLGEDAILTNIKFIDADHGFISGEFGTVLRTGDGGVTWERLADLPDGFYPHSMYFADAARGWVAGLEGQILHTGDGGTTWELQPAETQAPLYGLAAAGASLFAAGGEGVILREQDGRWVRFDHGLPVRLYLRAILPVDDGRLLVAGQAGALHLVGIAAP